MNKKDLLIWTELFKAALIGYCGNVFFDTPEDAVIRASGAADHALVIFKRRAKGEI